jgi:hypothetical protein
MLNALSLPLSAFHCDSKSAHVIGDPSFQFAFSLSLKVTFYFGLVSSFGSSAR